MLGNSITNIEAGLFKLRLKADPSEPNASLPNLKDFSNTDVTGLVKEYPDVRK